MNRVYRLGHRGIACVVIKQKLVMILNDGSLFFRQYSILVGLILLAEIAVVVLVVVYWYSVSGIWLSFSFVCY